MSMKGLWEGLGLALVIVALAVSFEFCGRPDKTQGPGKWLGCDCPPAEKP